MTNERIAVPMSLLAEHPNVQFNYFRGGIGTCEVENALTDTASSAGVRLVDPIEALRFD